MIDIFMGSILVALVQFDVLYNVTAGSGATAFAAVVLLTMIASRCYDPRLMWDAAERRPPAVRSRARSRPAPAARWAGCA